MSGGIDSAACANFLIDQGHKPRALFVDYGQAALKRERAAVKSLCAHFTIPLEVVTVSGVKNFSSGELVGRNAFLILSAVFLAQATSGILALGIHAGTPYYDCSPTFVHRMQQLIAEHTSGELILSVPFLMWRKGDVFEYFTLKHLPVGLTYSCESGTEPPCGKCASCKDRKALKC